MLHPFRAILIQLLVALYIFAACSEPKSPTFQLEHSNAIDKMMERKMKNLSIPGLALAIIKDGAVIKKSVYGYSRLSTNTPVNFNTSFQLASTTKTFTSTAVMQMINDGVLSLSDYVGQYLNNLPHRWRRVTIQQLLSHTSSLPDITRTSGQLDLIADTWENSLTIISDSAIQGHPGDRWRYSQTNYALLSQIIEEISGKPYAENLKDRIFEPLDMRNTFFISPDSTINVAENYELDSSKNLTTRDLNFPQFIWAAGGLYSSLNDLIAWNLALDSLTLIPYSIRDKMWTPINLNDGTIATITGSTSYGLGWVVDRGEDPFVGHSGGNSSAYRKYLKENLTIILLHNGNSNPDMLIDGIFRIIKSPSDEIEASAQIRLWDGAIEGDTAEISSSIKDGADINALDTRRSKSGRRALNWAAWHNHPHVIHLLLQHGASINNQNLTGFTPLHHAAEAGSLEAAKVLLEAGANKLLKNKSGFTPIETARNNKHEEIAKLIEEFSQ